jgi:hypothetical protein
VLNATFSYIMATSFSGGESLSTQKEQPTMGKQLVNFIICGYESSAPFFCNLQIRMTALLFYEFKFVNFGEKCLY